jgi:hypothetical protein
MQVAQRLNFIVSIQLVRVVAVRLPRQRNPRRVAVIILFVGKALRPHFRAVETQPPCPFALGIPGGRGVKR